MPGQIQAIQGAPAIKRTAAPLTFGKRRGCASHAGDYFPTIIVQHQLLSRLHYICTCAFTPKTRASLIFTRKSPRLFCQQGGHRSLPKASLASLSFSALYLIQDHIKLSIIPAINLSCCAAQWVPLQGRVDSTVSHQQPLMGGDDQSRLVRCLFCLGILYYCIRQCKQVV